MNSREAFLSQAEHCAVLGSPFLAQLMRLLAERLDGSTAVGKRLLAWPGDAAPRADAVPLRLAGALHALVLANREPALLAVWPPAQPDDDRLWAATEEAFRRHAEAILDGFSRPPQTNEVRRSAGLVPVFHLVARRFGLPLRLSELGASAGLNLHADRFSVAAGSVRYGPADATVALAPEWTGPAPEPVTLDVLERAGVDRTPFDLTDESDRLRLRSYIWPDQPDRLRRTDAAIALALAAEDPPLVEKGDAIVWLRGRLADPVPGTAHVVFHTIVWQYLAPAAKEEGQSLLASAGARAMEAAPLAQLAVEGDGREPGAAIALTVWPGGERHALGRMDFHGRWVDWTGPTELGRQA